MAASSSSSSKLEQSLSRLHSNDPTLTTLDLSCNEIGGSGASALATALQHNSILTTLDLSLNNQIGDSGASALAAALQHNSTLTTLDLNSNCIGFSGASALATALLHNSSLTTLNLNSNSISRSGASAFVTALQHNSSLTTLTLWTHSLTVSIDSQISTLLKDAPHRRQLAETKKAEEAAARLRAQKAAEDAAREEAERRAQRDQDIVGILDSMVIPAPIQDKLFDEEGLTREYIPFFTDDILIGCGVLPQVKARALLQRLQSLPSPSSPSPSFSSSPAHPHSPTGSSSTTPSSSFESKRSLPHLSDEESLSKGNGAQGMIYWAKYAGAPCVVKRFIHGINRPEFDREVHAWKEFRHPNIVQLLAFLGPPDAVIVMERMGCSLFDLLKDKSKPLPFLRRVQMGGQIAAGVSYLHAEGFVHRDIKSQNVLVRGEEVKLADFGDTRSAEQLRTLVSLKGTTRWIAPELYLGARPTQASDVFAMGMTLWELLCRQIPFVELGNDAAAITHNITYALRPAFAVHIDSGDDAGEDVIGRFKEVIICCWSQLPHMRPSAIDTLKMLNQILPAHTSNSTPPEPVEPPPVTDSEITRQMGRALQNDVMIGGYGSFSSSS